MAWPVSDASLEPDFAEALVLPVGEQADAVGGGFDGVEMLFHLIERKIFVNVLAHLEGRLDVERNFGDDAERAEADDSTVENIAVFGAREFDDIAICGDQFQRRDGAGEVAVLLAGAVRAGAARARDGDVRQGSEIVQREAFGVEDGREFAVGDAGIDGDRARGGVDRHGFVERAHREQRVMAVGDSVEAMARAECLQLGFLLHEVADLIDRIGRSDAIGAEFKIAGPVFEFFFWHGF